MVRLFCCVVIALVIGIGYSNVEYHRQIDVMTDADTSYVSAKSEDHTYDDHDSARLVIWCDGEGEYDVLVHFNFVLGATSVPIMWRFDAEPAASSEWHIRRWLNVALLPREARVVFMDQLLAAKQLAVRAENALTHNEHTIVIDVSSLPPVMGRLSCLSLP